MPTDWNIWLKLITYGNIPFLPNRVHPSATRAFVLFTTHSKNTSSNIKYLGPILGHNFRIILLKVW
jgi:hypothetical protein